MDNEELFRQLPERIAVTNENGSTSTEQSVLFSRLARSTDFFSESNTTFAAPSPKTSDYSIQADDLPCDDTNNTTDAAPPDLQSRNSSKRSLNTDAWHGNLHAVSTTNESEMCSSSLNKKLRPTGPSNVIDQTNSNSSSIQIRNKKYTINSIALFNPIHPVLSSKTDRYTELKDCFGQQPVLVLNGHLPKDVDLKLSMISVCGSNKYHSLFKFRDYHPDNTYKLEYVIRRPVVLCDDGEDCYIIELKGLFVQKEEDKDRRNEDKRFYNLMPFLSEKEDSVSAKGPTLFADKYNLKQPHLAVQIFPKDSEEPIKMNTSKDNYIFFSNILNKVPNTKSKVGYVKLNISRTNYGTFDDNGELRATFQIELLLNGNNELVLDHVCLKMSLQQQRTNSYSSVTDQTETFLMLRKITTGENNPIELLVRKKKSDEQAEMTLQYQPLIGGDNDTLVHENTHLAIKENECDKFHVKFELVPVITVDNIEHYLSYSNALLTKIFELSESIEHTTSAAAARTTTSSGVGERNSTSINLFEPLDYPAGQI